MVTAPPFLTDGTDLAGTPAHRYYDNEFRADAVRVLPGSHYVTGGTEMIVTTLGSCVAACIRDTETGIGGLNHFMLPEDKTGNGFWNRAGPSLRYGSYAMERLINDILRAGGRRQRLEVKVFGGGNVLTASPRIGDANAAFVLEYLEREGLAISAKDLGGKQPRRIHYFPSTGKAFMLLLRTQAMPDILRSEKAYKKRLVATPLAGDVELFGPED